MLQVSQTMSNYKVDPVYNRTVLIQLFEIPSGYKGYKKTYRPKHHTLQQQLVHQQEVPNFRWQSVPRRSNSEILTLNTSQTIPHKPNSHTLTGIAMKSQKVMPNNPNSIYRMEISLIITNVLNLALCFLIVGTSLLSNVVTVKVLAINLNFVQMYFRTMADNKCELISKDKGTKWNFLKCTLLNAHKLVNKYAQICSILQVEIVI